MRLSKNFSLDELTHTDTGLTNVPDETETEKLLYLASYVLQPVRDKWGPLVISSGYRSTAVNAHVGGASHSQHLFGEAADFVSAPTDGSTLWSHLDTLFRWLVMDSGIRFGQCIRESKGAKEWIHISLPRLRIANNQEALIIDDKGRRPYL